MNNPIVTQPSQVVKSDLLAERGRQAIKDWQDCDANEQSAKALKKLAVIEYGKVLLEGRKLYPSNNRFGDWVISNKLDVAPYDHMQARNAALRIAEFVLNSGIEDAFDKCPFASPTNMIQWGRETNLIELIKPKLTPAIAAPPAPPPPPPSPPSPPTQPVSRPTLVSTQTSTLVLPKEAKESIKAQAKQEAAAYGLSNKAENIVAKLLAKHKIDIAKEMTKWQEQQASKMQAAIEQEVARRIALAFPRYQENLDKAKEAERHYSELTDNRKPIFTAEEYRDILMALHPDNSAGKETRESAFRIFNAQKLKLTGKK